MAELCLIQSKPMEFSLVKGNMKTTVGQIELLLSIPQQARCNARGSEKSIHSDDVALKEHCTKYSIIHSGFIQSI